MTAVRAAILGLLLACCVCEALNKDYAAYWSTLNKEPVQKDRPARRQKACLLADGPKNKEECEVFEKRWVNKTEEKRRQKDQSIDLQQGFGNMSMKDVAVTIGCYAIYTFSQQMLDACVDANLLTDLLLCQYDNLENKDVFLKEFYNVKVRQDLIDFMEDLKKCTGTSEDPMEQLDGSKPGKITVMEIFIRPMKKMRSYIESNVLGTEK